jgi:hypothetical protein
VTPPSTLRVSSLTPDSDSMTSRTARVWKHTASSVARAMCAEVVYDVRPMMVPVASRSQYGARRPLKAVTK